MLFHEIIAGLTRHKEFIVQNNLVHLVAGIILATAIYPFLNEKQKERFNYFVIVFFPAVLGSMFPDLMFILSAFVKHRYIDGLFNVLTSGGDVYSAFHFGLPIILVVPTTVFFALVFSRIFKQKFDALPSWSILVMSIVSLSAALLHIFMDTIGF